MISINEIHPMLVHFPIVLWIGAEVIATSILLRKGDPAAREHWPITAFYCLLAGTVLGGLAALFGDTAMENAAAAGFSVAPMEAHETLAVITLSLFALHTLGRLAAIWRRFPLNGLRGWLAEIPGFVGIVLMIATAYLGGGLVYHLGVNVARGVS
jgi:uncharacterized membrane protein